MRGAAAATLVLVYLLTATPLAAQQPSSLNAPYSVTIGDVAASSLSELLKVRTDLRDPAIVTYEPDPGTIDVEVFASPTYGSKTDQARALLGKYWEFIQAAHLPYVKRRFNLELSAAQFRIIYYDAKAQDGPQPVLQFVGGQYLIP